MHSYKLLHFTIAYTIYIVTYYHIYHQLVEIVPRPRNVSDIALDRMLSDIDLACSQIQTYSSTHYSSTHNSSTHYSSTHYSSTHYSSTQQ